jgi:predicted N-acetyltransferase YhbS
VSQWEGVSDEVFLAIIFEQEIVQGVHGMVRYRDEFGTAME